VSALALVRGADERPELDHPSAELGVIMRKIVDRVSRRRIAPGLALSATAQHHPSAANDLEWRVPAIR
jgi:hypothetical protein